MRIRFWHTILFFVSLIILGVILFPSSREMGLFYFKSRDYAQVEAYLREQFNKDPHDLANAMRYLRTLNENGKFDVLLIEGEKLVAIFPEEVTVIKFMAKFFEDRLMLSRAVECWKKLVKISDEKEKRTYVKKLIAYYQSAKKYEDLIAIYSSQLDEEDVDEGIYYELARLYSLNNQISKTREVYQKLVERFPEEARGKRKLAELYEVTSDLDSALALYRKMADQSASDAELLAGYLDKLISFNRQNEAFDVLNQRIAKISNIRPVVQVISGYADQWRDENQWQTMLDVFYQRDPRDPITVRLLADLFYNNKDYEKSLSLLWELHKTDACDYYVHYLMGNVYLFIGNRPEAREQYELAIKHYERNSEIYTDITHKLIKADILRRLGRKNESLLVLNLVLKQDPENINALELTAENYWDLNRVRLAKDYLEKVYSSNQDRAEILKSLGELYVLLEDYQQAEKLLRSYHEKTGGDYRSYHMYGNVLAHLGDQSGSRSAYLEALRLIRQ